jgi:hypothetical protein
MPHRERRDIEVARDVGARGRGASCEQENGRERRYGPEHGSIMTPQLRRAESGAGSVPRR